MFGANGHRRQYCPDSLPTTKLSWAPKIEHSSSILGIETPKIFTAFSMLDYSSYRLAKFGWFSFGDQCAEAGKEAQGTWRQHSWKVDKYEYLIWTICWPKITKFWECRGPFVVFWLSLSRWSRRYSPLSLEIVIHFNPRFFRRDSHKLFATAY